MGVCNDICADKRTNKRRETEIKRQSYPEDNEIEDEIVRKRRGKIINNKISEKKILSNEKNNSFSSKKEIFKDNSTIINNSVNSKTTVKINANGFIFEEDSKVNFDLNLICNLKGILKLLALKYISSITTNENENEKIKEIKNKDLIKILQILNKDLELINKNGLIKNEKLLPNDVKIILKEKEGSNIIEYAKYIDSKVESQEIEDIINIHKPEQKEEIFKFLNSIMKYEKYNTFFEEEFKKAQKESIFDFSIVNLVLSDNKNFSKYEEAKKNCPNCTTKILFHGTQIDPASKIISSEFKYTKKAFYGMGIYFTDNLDYITFYSGGEGLDNRRINFNKIFPPNHTFTFIASEIFYDKNLLKHIRDNSYYVKELDHFPTYEEIKRKYKNKMIPKNGIHFITVKSDHGHALQDSITSIEERKKGKFIVNEYVITELEQICPLYAIKIKRNEFFLLWRDSNFKGENFYYDYLKRRELYANGIAKMNIYIESNTENALKFIYKRRFNKMILITSIGLDYSGKKFIEVARKILGSNIIVLIFSNNKEHLKWIQNFPNVLYTNNEGIYKRYIKNYNENGLKELKKEVEEKYSIKLLDFTNDFLSYPLYIDNEKYSSINLSEKSDYIKEVIIYNLSLNVTLVMKNNGIFEIVRGKNEDSKWDITMIDGEITLFSNGYYLGYDEKLNKIISDQYMKRWNYINTDNENYIIKTKNDLFITIIDNSLSLKDNNNENESHSLFQFIEID